MNKEKAIVIIRESGIFLTKLADLLETYDKPDIIPETSEIGVFEHTPPETESVFGSEPDMSTQPLGVGLDKNGLPWDVRIHAGTKTKTAKGVWKYKPGTPDELKIQVEAELRQVMSAPTIEQGGTPEPLEVQTEQAPPPPQQSTAITTFADLATACTAAGKSEADISAAVQAVGLPAFGALVKRADLIPRVANTLGL